MQKKASVPFIFVTILLDALGVGILIPVFPDVIRRFGTDPAFVNHSFGYFIAIYALMQFFASPILGSLSDRFGRRPVLLVSLLGAGLDYFLMAFAPSMAWLFAGRVFSGLTGASMTVASAYMADISDSRNRASNFGMIGAAFGLGFIFGPSLGGIFGHFGPAYPFIAAAVLNILNFAFGYFVLPESLPPEKRRVGTAQSLNPFVSLAKLLSRNSLRTMVAIYFLIYLGGNSHPSIWTLYTQYKFHWSTFEVGLSLTCVGLSIAIVQGGLTRVIIPKLGEERSIAYGLWFYILGFAGFAFATHSWMMYVILVFFSLSGIVAPSVQTLLAREVSASEQGELQGSLISLASITTILAPLIYTNLFSYFTVEGRPFHFPGAGYLAASLFCVIAWIACLRNKKTTESF